MYVYFIYIYTYDQLKRKTVSLSKIHALILFTEYVWSSIPFFSTDLFVTIQFQLVALILNSVWFYKHTLTIYYRQSNVFYQEHFIRNILAVTFQKYFLREIHRLLALELLLYIQWNLNWGYWYLHINQLKGTSIHHPPSSCFPVSSQKKLFWFWREHHFSRCLI